MKTLKVKSLLFSLLAVVAIAVFMTSCEQDLATISDEVIDTSVVMERITSMDKLEDLMEAEGYEATDEFANEFLYTNLRGCTNYSWESNSGCSGISTIWPVSTSGSSNYIGGCMQTPLIDYFKLRVNRKYYYVCAAGLTDQDNGRYLLRARVSNGKLVVTNLTFWGDRIDAVIGIYNSSCTPIGTSGVNSASAPL